MTEQLQTTPQPQANWRPGDDLYSQVSQLANSNLQPSDTLAGLLARALGRIFASYDSHETAFMCELLERWSHIDERIGNPKTRFHGLYTDKRFARFPAYSQGDRPRPKPFEAAIETCRRLITTNHIRDALAPVGTAGILGGSVAYGRFFNTKGVDDPSDLDLMIIVPDYSTHLLACAEALRAVPGISHEDVDRMIVRVPAALKLSGEHPNLSVSHKISFWADEMDPFLQPYDWHGAFLGQLHFFSVDAFSHVILKNQGFIGAGRKSTFHRDAKDFRDDRGRRGADGMLYSFAGTQRPFKRPLEAVDGGFLTNEVTCQVVDSRFYAGIFHNLILPQLEVRWDHLDFSVALAARAFAWKLFDRLTYERQLRPWEDQNLANSHIRRDVFSPHELRRVLTIDVWA